MRKRTRSRRGAARRIALAAIITALVLAGGYIQRGWVDWTGALALWALGLPLLLTWGQAEAEAKEKRAGARNS